MGAGGGAVSSLAFLSRYLSIGNDKLLATDEKHRVAGFYNDRTGQYQVAFGIPVPPGVREEGVSSIFCLNPHGAENESNSSHSALILAGSFDGHIVTATLLHIVNFFIQQFRAHIVDLDPITLCPICAGIRSI